MSFLWDDSYKTGLEEIDNQHMELLDVAAQLCSSPKTNNNKTVKEALDFLCKYVVNHFYIEESYQKKYNYPGYEEHKAMHSRFTDKLNNLKHSIGNNPSQEDLEKLSSIIVNWFKEHILEVDKKMGIYILNNTNDEL